MPAPDVVKSLVERFERNHEQYRSAKYNETQARQEFINPLFKALGWDIDNEQGFAEQYKEVIHEDTLEIEGASKAPDYAFRIGGTRKFFVEAKKPSVKLETDIHPAYQLRRYAWSAKLPLSVLTDFEEFAIYDCRVKPDKNDKASVGRVALFSYRDYVEKWDGIANIFSKDAIQKGSFDKYAEGIKGKKGTAEVDDAFLEEIERWRELLAKNIALRNEKLSVRELNFAVQATIDRIVFLRICEDRGVERDGQLKEIAEATPPPSLRDTSPISEMRNGGGREGVYSGLCRLFQQADARYDSGLFHFAKEKDESSAADSLTLNLKIDDKVLQDILQNLYYPDSPYVFREIPSDILGQVYERFLGKVIRLTAGHQAKVEEKPEVRKAGGVYYTPTYIVDYIVQNTVGKLLEGKSPKEVVRLKILDPACGSGTFPLGAYQYLLDWHLKWYTDHEPEKLAAGKEPVIYQSKDGWRLTTSKKKEILLNNIHGVDIDPQAVEVTKLSLLLKVLEGESQETVKNQYRFGAVVYNERLLPDLGQNIKCGNSLIGSDYYQDRQLTMLIDEEERYRVNAFDWKTEFSQVFIQGGFDVVMGNPPYVEIVGIEWDDRRFYEKAYSVKGRFDLYTLFILKAMQICNKNGFWSFVIPNKFATNLQFSEIRHSILSNYTLESVLSFEGFQFKNAGVNSIVICCHKQPPNSKDQVTFLSWLKGKIQNIGQQEQSILLTMPNYNFSFLSFDNSVVVDRIRNASMPFDVFFDVKDGIVAGDIKDSLFSEKRIDEDSHKLFFGKGLQRYSLVWTDMWVSYKPQEMMELEIKRKGKKRPGLWMREKSIFEKPKIITRKVATHIIATFDNDQVYYEQTLHGSILRSNHNNYDERYFLGILNSRLMKFYYQSTVQQKGKLFPQIRINVLKSLPMHPISFSDPADKARHDKMVSLVERMLSLHKQSPKTPQEQEMVKREIESTDREIDQLVYELYGLSEEERKIVEGK
jgi:type I restriction-modification system DNA methylase subunit